MKVGQAGRPLRFVHIKSPATRLAETLSKTAYLDPRIEEIRDAKIRDLRDHLHVDKVQVGLFYTAEPGHIRAFSVEWEGDYTERSLARLCFDYKPALIRVRLGNQATEQHGMDIIVKFSNVRNLNIFLDFADPGELFSFFPI